MVRILDESISINTIKHFTQQMEKRMDTMVDNDPKQGIGDIIKESWELISGFKWNFMKVFILMMAVVIVAELLFFHFFQPGMFHPDPVTHKYPQASPYLTLVISYFSYLFVIPLSLMGVRRAIGLPTSAGAAFKAMFDSFSNIIAIIVALMLIAFGFDKFANYMSTHHSLGIIIVYIVALLVNILISLTGLFAILLVITKKINMNEAIAQSLAGVVKHIGLLLATYILLMVIMILSAIPFGIGLIWTIPMSFIIFGILFRNIYGVKNAVSLANAQPGASEYSF